MCLLWQEAPRICYVLASAYVYLSFHKYKDSKKKDDLRGHFMTTNQSLVSFITMDGKVAGFDNTTFKVIYFNNDGFILECSDNSDITENTIYNIRVKF